MAIAHCISSRRLLAAMVLLLLRVRQNASAIDLLQEQQEYITNAAQHAMLCSL